MWFKRWHKQNIRGCTCSNSIMWAFPYQFWEACKYLHVMWSMLNYIYPIPRTGDSKTIVNTEVLAEAGPDKVGR